MFDLMILRLGYYPIWLLTILACLPMKLSADAIYVYKENGIIKFTNKPPKDGKSATVFRSGKAAVSYYRRGPSYRRSALYKSNYTSYITQASRKYSVPPSLIRAVIHAESSFNPMAVSPKGAKGLMQLMDSNKKRVGVSNSFSPSQNIDGGVRLLALLIKKYNGNKKLALAAYNAGEGAVSRHGGIPPYRETQQYVSKVLALAARYQSAMYD